MTATKAIFYLIVLIGVFFLVKAIFYRPPVDYPSSPSVIKTVEVVPAEPLISNDYPGKG